MNIEIKNLNIYFNESEGSHKHHHNHCKHHHQSCKYKFITDTIFFNNLKIKGNMNTVIISDVDAQGAVGVISFGAPVSAAGNVTTIEAGTFSVTSSNEAVATAVVSPEDGEYAIRVSLTGVAGSADIKVSADADLDAGDDQIRLIEGMVSVVVEVTEAVGFGEAVVGPFVK